MPDTARFRERLQAAYSVRAGTAVRRAASPTELLALTRAIERPPGMNHLLGVRTLCQLQLNVLLAPLQEDDVPAATVAETRINRAGWIDWLQAAGVAERGNDPNRHPDQLAPFWESLQGTAWRNQLTLLDYACWRTAPEFACALLRGGADPFPQATGACRTALVADLPDEGSIWLLCAVVRLRFSAVAARRTRCDGCGAESASGGLALWPECEHCLCGTCIWTDITAANTRPIAAMLHCPCCCAPAAERCFFSSGIGEISLLKAPQSTQRGTRWIVTANTECQDVDESQAEEQWAVTTWRELVELSTPAERKAVIQARWRTRHFRDAHEQQAVDAATTKKGQKGLRPMPPAVAMVKQLRHHCSAADTTGILLRAAGTGDMMWMRAVLVAGCDLEAGDECGQTAALLAAWRGHAAVLELLHWAGADFDSATHAGITVPQAAVAPWAGKSKAAIADCIGVIARQHPMLQKEEDQPPLPAPPAGRLVTLLLPLALAPHPGAGSTLYVDNGLSEHFLSTLDGLHQQLVSTAGSSPLGSAAAEFSSRSYSDTSATRTYHCDVTRSIAGVLEPLAAVALGKRVTMLSRCRFLCYHEVGGDMRPHVDLFKPLDEFDATGSLVKSTHTFMLHLADCHHGGETVFLSRINQAPNLNGAKLVTGTLGDDVGAAAVATGGGGVLGAAAPRRGRLIVFPHMCPHSGLPVQDVPKLFLRGELLVEE